MSKALESIIGHAPLTESLRATSSGVPNPFPPELFTVSPRNRVLGDRAKYIRITGERRTAKRVVYGAPGKRRALRDVGEQGVRCFHNSESFALDMTILQKLQAFEQYTQDEGMDFLAYQIQEAAKRQQNTRVITTGSILRHGAVYWDSEGNLLPTSSGADASYTIDFGVPASHKDQINGIVTAPWSLVNTDIPGHIRAIKNYARQETGLELTAALYGKNISKYIMQNNLCQAFMSRNDSRNEKFLATGEISSGLFDIADWRPVYSSFYEKDDGTIAEVWDDDLIVFLPEISQPDKMNWWAMYEGSYPVPRSLDVQRDPMSAIRNFEIVYGQGSYATITVTPPGVDVHDFDTFLPAIRNEKATFHVDTAF